MEELKELVDAFVKDAEEFCAKMREYNDLRNIDAYGKANIGNED